MRTLLFIFIGLLGAITSAAAATALDTVARMAHRGVELAAEVFDDTIPAVSGDEYTLERVVRRHMLQELGGTSDSKAMADFLGIGVGVWALAGYAVPKDVDDVLRYYKQDVHWYWHVTTSSWRLPSSAVRAIHCIKDGSANPELDNLLLKRVIAQHIVDVCKPSDSAYRCKEILRETQVLLPQKYCLNIYKGCFSHELIRIRKWFVGLGYVNKQDCPEGLKRQWQHLQTTIQKIEDAYQSDGIDTLPRRFCSLENAKREFCSASQKVRVELIRRGQLAADSMGSQVLTRVRNALGAQLKQERRYEEAAEYLAAEWRSRISESGVETPVRDSVVLGGHIPLASATPVFGELLGAGGAGTGAASGSTAIDGGGRLARSEASADAPPAPLSQPVVSGSSMDLAPSERIHPTSSVPGQGGVALDSLAVVIPAPALSNQPAAPVAPVADSPGVPAMPGGELVDSDTSDVWEQYYTSYQPVGRSRPRLIVPSAPAAPQLEPVIDPQPAPVIVPQPDPAPSSILPGTGDSDIDTYGLHHLFGADGDDWAEPDPALQPAPVPAHETPLAQATLQLPTRVTPQAPIEPVLVKPKMHTGALATLGLGGTVTLGSVGYALGEILKDKDSRAVVGRAFKKLIGKKVAPLMLRQQRAAKRLQTRVGGAGVATVLGLAALATGGYMQKRGRTQ